MFSGPSGTPVCAALLVQEKEREEGEECSFVDSQSGEPVSQRQFGRVRRGKTACRTGELTRRNPK